MFPRRALAILLATGGLWPACRGASTTADAAPAASSAPSPVTVETSSPEQAWIEARTGDPLELARLANVEGVHRLAEVAGDPHASAEDRATAIRAIAHATDPSPALETLTKIVAEPEPSSTDRSTLALQTIAYVAPKRAPIEELEPAAWRVCGDGLLAALKSMQGAARRELALSALRSLVDRGAVNGAAIPAH